MRIMLKVLLFPVTLALSLLVAICRLACQLSGMVLGILAFAMFAISLGVMIILQDFHEGVRMMGLALLVSPFGIPLIATFLIELLGVFNETLKEI
jgi:hypothetical protein